MKTSIDNYFVKAPAKILERAEIYSKTLQNFHQLPKQISKSLVVQSGAFNEKEDIQFAIKMSEYQKNIYRKKETADLKDRKKHRQILQAKSQKTNQKLKDLQKKTKQKNQNYEKHVKLVFNRYTEAKVRDRINEKQKAEKLKSKMLEFFQKEHQRKQKSMKNQISVAPCYSQAVEKLNNIHKQNQEYAKRAEKALEKELHKNNKFQQRIAKKRRILSQCNKRKEEVLNQSLDILENRQLSFIQTCGKNENGYLQAWDKIGKSVSEMRKKRGEQMKIQLEKWKQNKHRVDEIKAGVPDRCLSILDKTSKASFRQTASSFRSSVSKFEDIVQKNKEAIREEDQSRRDQIIDLHLDLRLKNNANHKITQKMHSMRQQAKMIAYDFL